MSTDSLESSSLDQSSKLVTGIKSEKDHQITPLRDGLEALRNDIDAQNSTHATEMQNPLSENAKPLRKEIDAQNVKLEAQNVKHSKETKALRNEIDALNVKLEAQNVNHAKEVDALNVKLDSQNVMLAENAKAMKKLETRIEALMKSQLKEMNEGHRVTSKQISASQVSNIDESTDVSDNSDNKESKTLILLIM